MKNHTKGEKSEKKMSSSGKIRNLEREKEKISR